jgi:cytidylate kinase
LKNVITIDGPSGAGKGTVAKALARELSYKYLDTGALYRAIAWKARKEKISLDNISSVKIMMENTNIKIANDRIMVDDVDVTSDIRTNEIGELSSKISALPVVRKGLFNIQKEICLQGNVVIEGRDTGTTIFPEAENKFFLDASLEERARRRYEELKKQSPDITVESTMEDIRKRDMRDSSRKNSPLKKTDDMIQIDSTNMSIKKVVLTIIENLK